MSDERRGDGEAEGPPPPSPLTGGYLLVVLPQLHSSVHKDRLLHALTKGLITWDAQECHVDLDKELQNITAQAPEGEEAKNGERLIQFASENLVTEVLIHPQLNTLVQCMRNCLSSFTRHRHIIHAGYTSAGNGAWVLQDGTYSFSDFADMYSEHEVQRVLRAYEGTVSVDVHCSGEGDWWALKAKDPFSKVSRVRLNPPDKGTATTAVRDFLNYLSQYLVPAGLNDLLEPSDVVGNIRFSHPTLYVFPGGQGDAALFGINGFNMLVDGGFSRKACFWDFTRHLDRLDSVLMTRINNGNLQGLASLLKRKKSEQVYPQIGHFFSNIPDRKQVLSPDGDKDRDPLLINLIEQGQEMLSGLRHLGLKPQPCYREPSVEPINLYHKVGHGKLDMYVLSPAKDSREVREFLAKWAAVDSKIFCSYSRKGEFNFPLSSKTSICALLVWQPANPEDNITRLLFPGSTPQQKIFEGLDRLKNLEFMKHPICSAKSLSPTSSTIKLSIKSTPKPAIIEKVAEIEKKQSETVKAVKQVGEIKKATPPAPKPKPKADRPKEKPKTDLDSKPETVKIDKKTTEAVQKVEKELKKEKPKRTMQKPQEKKTQKPPEKKNDSIKSSPTTPKKTVENKLTEMAATKTEMKTRASKAKASPTSTPAKSAKEENNRKVVELKSRESTKLQKAPSTKREEPKKIEKPVGKKSTASPKGVKSLSPIKAAKPSAKQRLDVKKTSKTEKDIITDSSAVSTPSTVDAELTKAKEEAEKTKEITESKLGDVSRKASDEIGKSISKEDDDEILIIEKVEISDETTGKADVEKIALHLQKPDDEIKKITKEQQASVIEEKETADTLSQEQAVGDTVPSSETKQVAQEEVQDIIETATEIVTKRLDIQKTDSQEISGKDLGSTDKIVTPKEREMKSVDVEQKIDESQPDERFSTTVESGATTTAPTLPEDERIPLDEIKEGIEEKHVKEETKEKEIIATPRPEQPTSLPQVPVIAGTVFDQRAQLLKDIVKTPDEVADLPVHEEVDVGIYEGAGKDELLSLPSMKKEKKDDTTEEIKLFKDNLEKEDKSKDLKEDMVESVDVLSHTTTDLDMISSSPKSGKPLESDEKEDIEEVKKLEYEKSDVLERRTDKVSEVDFIEKKEKEVKISGVEDQLIDKPKESKEITEKETIESKEKEAKAPSIAKLQLEKIARPSSAEEIETEKDEGVCLDETTPQLESKGSIVAEEKEKTAVEEKEHISLEEKPTEIKPEEFIKKTETKEVDQKLLSEKEVEKITPEKIQGGKIEEIEPIINKFIEKEVSEEKRAQKDTIGKDIPEKETEDQKLGIQDSNEKLESEISLDSKLEGKDTTKENGFETDKEKRKEEEAKTTPLHTIEKAEITSPNEKKREEIELEESKLLDTLDISADEQKESKVVEEEMKKKKQTPEEKTLAIEIAESEKSKEIECEEVLKKESGDKVIPDEVVIKETKTSEKTIEEPLLLNEKLTDQEKPVKTSVIEKKEGEEKIIPSELKKSIPELREVSEEITKKADEQEPLDLQKTVSETAISTKEEIKPTTDIEESDKDKILVEKEAKEEVIKEKVSGTIKSEIEESIKTEIQETVQDIDVQKTAVRETATEIKEDTKLIAEVEKIETKTEATETITKSKTETSDDNKLLSDTKLSEELEQIRLEKSILVNGLIKEEMILTDNASGSLISNYEIEHVTEDNILKKTPGEELESVTKELAVISSEPDETSADEKPASSGIIEKDIKAEIKAIDLTAETKLSDEIINEKPTAEDLKDITKPVEKKIKEEIKPDIEKKDSEIKTVEEKRETESIPSEKEKETETKVLKDEEEDKIKQIEEKLDAELKSIVEKKADEVKPVEEKEELAIKTIKSKEETEIKQIEEMKIVETKATRGKNEIETKPIENKEDIETKLSEIKKDIETIPVEDKEETEVKTFQGKNEYGIKAAEEQKETEIQLIEEKEQDEIKPAKELKEAEVNMIQEMKISETKLPVEQKEEIKTVEETKQEDIKQIEEIKPIEEKEEDENKLTEEKKELGIKSVDGEEETEIKQTKQQEGDEMKPDKERKKDEVDMEIKEEKKQDEAHQDKDMKGVNIKLTEENREIETEKGELIESEKFEELEFKQVEKTKEGKSETNEEYKIDKTKEEEKDKTEMKVTEEIKQILDDEKRGEIKAITEHEQVSSESQIFLEHKKEELKIITSEEKKIYENDINKDEEEDKVKQIEEKDISKLDEKSVETEEKEDTKQIDKDKKESGLIIVDDKGEESDWSTEKKEVESRLATETKEVGLKQEEKKYVDIKSNAQEREDQFNSLIQHIDQEIEEIKSEENMDFESKLVKEKKDTKPSAMGEMTKTDFAQIEDELQIPDEKQDIELKSADDKKEIEWKSAEEIKETPDEKQDIELKLADDKKEIELKSAEEKKETQIKSAEDKRAIELRSADEKKEIELKSADEKKEIELKSADEKKGIELRSAGEKEDAQLKIVGDQKEKDAKKELELKLNGETKTIEFKSADKEEEQLKTGEEKSKEEKELQSSADKKDIALKSLEEKKEIELKSADERKEIELKSAEEKEGIVLKSAEEKKGIELKSADEKKGIELKSATEKKDIELKSAEEKEELSKISREKKDLEIKTDAELKDGEIKLLEEKKEVEEKQAEEKNKLGENLKEVETALLEEGKEMKIDRLIEQTEITSLEKTQMEFKTAEKMETDIKADKSKKFEPADESQSKAVRDEEEVESKLDVSNDESKATSAHYGTQIDSLKSIDSKEKSDMDSTEIERVGEKMSSVDIKLAEETKVTEAASKEEIILKPDEDKIEVEAIPTKEQKESVINEEPVEKLIDNLKEEEIKLASIKTETDIKHSQEKQGTEIKSVGKEEEASIKQEIAKETIEKQVTEEITIDKKQQTHIIDDHIEQKDVVGMTKAEVLTGQETMDAMVKSANEDKMTEVKATIEKAGSETGAIENFEEIIGGKISFGKKEGTPSISKDGSEGPKKVEEIPTIQDKMIEGKQTEPIKTELEKVGLLSEIKTVQESKTTVSLTYSSISEIKSTQDEEDKILSSIKNNAAKGDDEKREFLGLETDFSLTDNIVVDGQKETESKPVEKKEQISAKAESTKTASITGQIESESKLTSEPGSESLTQQNLELKPISGHEKGESEAELPEKMKEVDIKPTEEVKLMEQTKLSQTKITEDIEIKQKEDGSEFDLKSTKVEEKSEIKQVPESKEVINQLEYSNGIEIKPTDDKKQTGDKLPPGTRDHEIESSEDELIGKSSQEKEQLKAGLDEEKQVLETKLVKSTTFKEDFEFSEESIDKHIKKGLFESEDVSETSKTIKTINNGGSDEAFMMKAMEVKTSEKTESCVSESLEQKAKENGLDKSIKEEKEKKSTEEQLGYLVSSKLPDENGYHHKDTLEESKELQKLEKRVDKETEGKAHSSKITEEVFANIEKKMGETTSEVHSKETVIHTKVTEDDQKILSSESKEIFSKTEKLGEESSNVPVTTGIITSTLKTDTKEGSSSLSSEIITDKSCETKPTDLPKAEKGALDSSIKEEKTEKIKDETLLPELPEEVKESKSHKAEFSMESLAKEITTSEEQLLVVDPEIKESHEKKVNGFAESKVTSEYEGAASSHKTEGKTENTFLEYTELGEVNSEQKEMVAQEITDLTSVKVEKDTANADLKSKMKDDKQVGVTDKSAVSQMTDKEPSLEKQSGEITDVRSLKYTNGKLAQSEQHSTGISEISKLNGRQDEIHSEESTTIEKRAFTNGKDEQLKDETRSVTEVETTYSESNSIGGITTVTTVTKTITTTTVGPEEVKGKDTSKSDVQKKEETIITTETKSLVELDKPTQEQEEMAVITETKSFVETDKPLETTQKEVESTTSIEGVEKSEQVSKVEKIITEKHEIESVKDLSDIKAKFISEVTPAVNGSSAFDDSKTSVIRTETILNGSLSEPQKTLDQPLTEGKSILSEIKDSIKTVSAVLETQIPYTIKTEKSKISLELEKCLETAHRDKTESVEEVVKEASEASSSHLSTESKPDTLKDISMIKDMTASFISTERWTDRRTDTPEGRASPSSEATWRESDDDLPPSPMSTTSHLHSPPPAMYSSMYGPDDDSDISFGKPDIDFETAAREHAQTRGETLPKDPIEKWGKPLGLPPPPSGKDYWSPFKEWGRPLHLPSPAPAPAENDTEDTSGSTKTTPKKVAKMNEENNRYASNIVIGKEANNKNRRSDSPVKRNVKDGKKTGMGHIYLDLSYVPHHGNSHYANVEFFKRVRARYYVFSGTEPSKEVFNALLEAKQQWEDKDLEVTIIPTYDTDTLGYWIAENEETLSKYKIDLSPSASRCTINLQDHDTSCSAYRLEF